jgi:hypothetical protein
MEFICAHCEKPIRCSAILVDNTFLHSTCEEQFLKEKEEIEDDKLEEACS